MSITESDLHNFQMLAVAFHRLDVVLMDCQVVETGEAVPLICMVNHLASDRAQFIPCAQLLQGNPYHFVNLPRADGSGFMTQAELRGDLN